MNLPPKNQTILLVVLGITVAAVWVRGLTVRPSRGKSTPPAAVAPQPLPQPVQPLAPAPPGPEYAEWGDNPFLADKSRPLPDQVKGGSRLFVLQGILWDPVSPTAVLNGQVVEVGDNFDGWQVMEIDREKVVLSDGETLEVLTHSLKK